MDSFWTTILTSLQDVLITVASAVVAIVGLWIRNFLAARTSQITTDKLMNVLHTAIDSGVKAALAASPDAKVQDIISGALKHVEASIPDTLGKLAPTATVLTNLALSKLFSIKLQAAASSPKTPAP